MKRIRYNFCANGEEYAVGKTNFKESLGCFIEPNGCTLLICTSGQAVATVNFQKRTLKKGDVAILFYGTMLVVDSTSKSFSALYLSLPSAAIEDALFKMTSLPFWEFIYMHPIFQTSKKHLDLFVAWHQQMQWIIDEGLAKHQIAVLSHSFSNLLTAVDYELLRLSIYSENHGKKDRGWVLIGKFDLLLSKYIKQRRDVKFYADKLCISQDYLYKLSQKWMGISPKTLIDQQILIELKILLSNTDLPVKHIAEELSFDDPSYLCRFFHRMTGLSPIAYRNQKSSRAPSGK